MIPKAVFDVVREKLRENAGMSAFAIDWYLIMIGNCCFRDDDAYTWEVEACAEEHHSDYERRINAIAELRQRKLIKFAFPRREKMYTVCLMKEYCEYLKDQRERRERREREEQKTRILPKVGPAEEVDTADLN